MDAHGLLDSCARHRSFGRRCDCRIVAATATIEIPVLALMKLEKWAQCGVDEKAISHIVRFGNLSSPWTTSRRTREMSEFQRILGYPGIAQPPPSHVDNLVLIQPALNCFGVGGESLGAGEGDRRGAESGQRLAIGGGDVDHFGEIADVNR